MLAANTARETVRRARQIDVRVRSSSPSGPTLLPGHGHAKDHRDLQSLCHHVQSL